MKTKTCDHRQLPAARKLRWAQGDHSCHVSRVTCHVSAFTLVELLVVIAIITVIAALLFPLAGAVKREAYLHATQSEMAQIETAIARYHSVYGFYPPDNTNTVNSLTNARINQLYYELVGTRQTNISGQLYYVTLDGGSTISAKDVSKRFGVRGFMNCNRPGADESAPSAQDFLPDLKPAQIGLLSSNGIETVDVLAASAGGPAGVYTPVGVDGLNPWRYVSPGTNNVGSYDMWVQLVIGSKSNLVCNWTKQLQINNGIYP